MICQYCGHKLQSITEDDKGYVPADLVREVVEAAKEAKRQIEYLHGKFQETGTGNAVIARLQSALAALKAM